MSFNYKKATTSAEKYLRNENIGPKADDEQTITEKELPHREGNKDSDTITEDHIVDQHKNEKEAQVIEKILNEVDGKYITHRKEVKDLTIPPINAIVEKMREDRMKDYKPVKESHWTIDFNDKEQNGDLPAWPKSPDTKGINHYDLNQWNKKHPESAEVVKGVTKSDVDTVIHGIKTGRSLEFDTAIVAILRQADAEKRDLSDIERKTITQIKCARTKHFLQK